jgi:hypothetical protein
MTTPNRASTSSATAEIYGALQESFRDIASNGTTKRALDDFESFLTRPGTLAQPSLIIRCRITNRRHDVRVVVDKQISRWRLSTCFVPFLERALTKIQGCSDFFVLVSDKVYVEESARSECLDYLRNVPFLRCDRSGIDALSMHCILIPDYFVQDETYRDDLAAIGEAVSKTPFERRRNLIKWRGSLSGEEYPDLANYRRFPRYRLTKLSVRHPDILDARLTNYDFGDNEAGPALRAQLVREFGPPAETLSAASFVAYKYLISLDGVGAAWKRVATILACGSVLLLHNRWHQFFYAALRPWVNYVPVSYDLSDVVERYEWLVAHPTEARTIAENGLRLARETLSPEALETYFAAVINCCTASYRS